MHYRNRKRLLDALPNALLEYDPSLHWPKDFKELGSGMTSIVFRLKDQSGKVIKVMDTRCDCQEDTDSPEDVCNRKGMRDYFLQEIDNLHKLADSPYIVEGEDPYEYVFPEEKRLNLEKRFFRSLFFLRMPCLPTLGKYMRTHQNRTERVLVHIAIDICSAFQDCARFGIIHRDVKPENIFVDTSDRDREFPRFILGDFGFSRELDYRNNSPVTFAGTPGFIAPEIASRSPLNGRLNADIYSLGITLFYLSSNGKFPPDVLDVVRRGKSPRLLPKISPEFERIILNAIQTDPGKRYQTAGEMLHELSALSTDSSCVIVENYAFLEAKQAILRGNYLGAKAIAERSYRQEGRKDCKRLLAYCLYRLHHEGGDYRDSDHSGSDDISRAKQMLEELACEGDAVARYIRADIYGQENELNRYAENLRSSADEGCVIAQSRYGRFLWTGQIPSIPRDYQNGLKYLCMAAEEGFLPALRFLKREKEANPALSLPDSPVLEEFMVSADVDNWQQNFREEILRFL